MTDFLMEEYRPSEIEEMVFGCSHESCKTDNCAAEACFGDACARLPVHLGLRWLEHKRPEPQIHDHAVQKAQEQTRGCEQDEFAAGVGFGVG